MAVPGRAERSPRERRRLVDDELMMAIGLGLVLATMVLLLVRG